MCMIAQRPGESGDIQVPPALFPSQQAPVLVALPAYNDIYDPYGLSVDHRGSAAIIVISKELVNQGSGSG
jgi:hypothetical protein